MDGAERHSTDDGTLNPDSLAARSFSCTDDVLFSSVSRSNDLSIGDI